MIALLESAVLNDIQVRRATVADAIALALLARITFAETFEPHFTNKQGLLEHYEATFAVRKIGHDLQDPNNVFWIATHNHLPVGYVKLKKQAAPEAQLQGRCSQLEKIYVLKDYLSKGVGHQLQTALFEELQVLQTDNVWLYVWEQNSRAISFYQKHGFRVVNSNYATVGQDRFRFLTMAKRLYYIY